jgi:hypothetical protein
MISEPTGSDKRYLLVNISVGQLGHIFVRFFPFPEDRGKKFLRKVGNTASLPKHEQDRHMSVN